MTSLGAALVGVGLVACGPSGRSQRAADSAIAAARTRSVTQAGEVLTARREAQDYLDSARAQFVAHRPAAAKASLYQAARFTQEQANAGDEPAKTALIKSARELDLLALRIGKRSVGSVSTLDHAFARVQLAETQYHCVRAVKAWHDKDNAATSAELMMLADHLERAAVDAGEPLGPNAKAALTEARDVSSKLAQGVVVAAVDVDGALADIDKQVHALMDAAANLR